MGKPTIDGIYNYLPISATVASSGQPMAHQFAVIRDAGYKTVINLALADADNAVKGEGEMWRGMGVRYVHIPVDFKNPTLDDFDKFVAAMRESANEKTWVHCAANMRASAFLYRYRRDVLGENPKVARQALEKIWEPSGVWKEFVAEQQGR